MNPLVMIGTYILAFKYIMRIRATDGVNMSALIITGIIYWTLFSSLCNAAPNAILSDSGLIMKVRFPRIISIIRSHLFILSEHFLIYPIFFIAMYGWYHTPVTWSLLFFFVIFILLNLFVLGISLFLATATVFYRDIAHFIGLGLQIVFWLTPIVYPPSMVPDKYFTILSKLPATPFILSFYDIFLYGRLPSAETCVLMVGYTTVSLLVGFTVFYRYQHTFAEEI